ncbi:Protein kinase-like domain [Pseudocohnilembus persalinus]|uniref:Protein kinase-like domain n=1 Tax=Pseudocohnilembus persalinus TaxID=266149 RepID=A0A0V0QPB3_PSEPJ|nr:Protein kinase-like domain [Pseudocohnilembus persalinus]|eukprot:KRX03969.1 Protein kinase-like domain [Pseudocohnilembus persalinus]
MAKMLNSVVHLNVTPQKQNNKYLHTLEDMIGDDNIQQETEFDDWKFLKLIHEIPESQKSLKFIHKQTNNVYALKCYQNKFDYDIERQQIDYVNMNIGEDKANQYLCICADRDDKENILFYEIGDCSLRELTEVMGENERFWFEPTYFLQLNFLILNSYKILKYLIENNIYPNNITIDNIQLFRVGPRGDLRPKFMDIFYQESVQAKKFSSFHDMQGHLIGEESQRINMARQSYRQLGLAILEALHSSIVALEKQRRKTFYLDMSLIAKYPYQYPHLSEREKLNQIDIYYGGVEKHSKCTIYDEALQQDVVGFVKSLLQRGNQEELDKMFQQLEDQVQPLLDIDGFQRQVIVKQLKEPAEALREEKEENIIDELQMYLDLELIDCGQQLLSDLEEQGISLSKNKSYLYYRMRYFLLLGQKEIFTSQIKLLLNNRAKYNFDYSNPKYQKSDEDYLFEVLFAISDHYDEDQKQIAFNQAYEYFSSNYGKFDYKTLRIIRYQAEMYQQQSKFDNVIILLEPWCQDLYDSRDEIYHYQKQRIEIYVLFIKACLKMGKYNKRDYIEEYLIDCEKAIKLIKANKTALNGDIKFVQGIFVSEVERDKEKALKYFYESLQLYKNSIGKKSVKYCDVLHQICIILNRNKQYDEVLPFTEEHLTILQQILHYNGDLDQIFKQIQQKLYETYLHTSTGHQHLLDTWLNQGQYFADAHDFDLALEYMNIGKWLIDKDYLMKLKKKSPGIIYVPSYEMDVREKLIKIRKEISQTVNLSKRESLNKQALVMIEEVFQDESHVKQEHSQQYFEDQYFHFSLAMVKLQLILLRQNQDVNSLKYKDIWETIFNCLKDKYNIYHKDKFKKDTIAVFQGVCQKYNHDLTNQIVFYKAIHIQEMIFHRYEKLVMNLPKYVHLNQVTGKNLQSYHYIPNSQMKNINDLSGSNKQTDSQQQKQQSTDAEKSQTACQIF